MAVIDVPVNTMLADLDESLQLLLARELRRHGFDGVDVVFEAPTREWSASLSSPTVALYLYDLREAADLRRGSWQEQRAAGGAWIERPPLMVDCSYSVTAWTRAVQDEHRLLSQVLGILYAYTDLPREVLEGRLEGPLRGRAGQAREGSRPEFWTALGGQYKPSVDYVVTLPCPAGTVVQRGPQVRTQVVRTELVGLPGDAEARHRVGGTVRTADGEPVPDAWVVVHGVGPWATSGPDGHFRLDGVAPGRHRISVRTPSGATASDELVVPGGGVDLRVA